MDMKNVTRPLLLISYNISSGQMPATILYTTKLKKKSVSGCLKTAAHIVIMAQKKGGSEPLPLPKLSLISCNNGVCHLCHASQLGKHVRLPFERSRSISVMSFQLICGVHDTWISPVIRNSCYEYFCIIFDDFCNYFGAFPLLQ